MLTKVPEFCRTRPNTPLHLLFSFDEEVGCIGVRRALEGDLATCRSAPAPASSASRRKCRSSIGHKGKKSVRCHVHGKECHSSLAPQGVNAVEYAAEVDRPSQGHGPARRHGWSVRRRFRRRPFDGPYRHHPWRHGAQHRAEGLPLRFRVPLCAGRRAGSAAWPRSGLRSKASCCRRCRQVEPETGFSWEPLSSFPGLDTPVDAEIVAFVKSLTGANGTARSPSAPKAGLFQEIGIPDRHLRTGQHRPGPQARRILSRSTRSRYARPSWSASAASWRSSEAEHLVRCTTPASRGRRGAVDSGRPTDPATARRHSDHRQSRHDHAVRGRRRTGRDADRPAPCASSRRRRG